MAAMGKPETNVGDLCRELGASQLRDFYSVLSRLEKKLGGKDQVMEQLKKMPTNPSQ